jgi:thioesterase domain-containing protein
VLDYGADLPPHRRRLVEANLRAFARYQPRPYDGRVMLFEAAVRPLFDVRDPGQGWRELSPLVDVIRLPTTHEGMFRPPCVDLLAGSLRTALS